LLRNPDLKLDSDKIIQGLLFTKHEFVYIERVRHCIWIWNSTLYTSLPK